MTAIQTMTDDYSTLTQADLRRLCIERAREAGSPTSWVALARKADMIGYLSNGTLPGAAVPASVQTTTGGLVDMITDMARIAVEDAVAAVEVVRPLQVTIGDAKPVQFERAPHEQMLSVLERARWARNVLLVGPAGTGKTTIAADVAKALSRPFSFLSLSAGVTETHLWGRMLPGAGGEWVFRESAFVKTYRDGGVFLFDEVDAADANVLVGINAALANGHLSNPYDPDAAVIPRHPDCLIICAANTFGRGADRQYVGRNALDAATLDRFTCATLNIDYDTGLESRIMRQVSDVDVREELADWITRLRERISAARLRRIASTRLVISAVQMLACGASLADVKAAYFVDWSEDEKAKVL